MYRDTFRAIALCSLARTALDAGDRAAAAAALHQVMAHLHGRPRTLGGGFLMVQALAGLVRAGGNPGQFEQALRLFRERDRFSFAILWTCSDEATLVELGRAAIARGRPDAVALHEQARDAATYEARLLLQKEALTRFPLPERPARSDARWSATWEEWARPFVRWCVPERIRAGRRP